MGGMGTKTVGGGEMISIDAVFLAIAKLWNIKNNLNLILRKVRQTQTESHSMRITDRYLSESDSDVVYCSSKLLDKCLLLDASGQIVVSYM